MKKVFLLLFLSAFLLLTSGLRAETAKKSSPYMGTIYSCETFSPQTTVLSAGSRASAAFETSGDLYSLTITPVDADKESAGTLALFPCKKGKKIAPVAEPVSTYSFESLGNHSPIELKFDPPLHSGKYLWVLTLDEGSVTFKSSDKEDSPGQCFLDKEKIPQTLFYQIQTDTPIPFIGAWSTYQLLLSPSITPEEPAPAQSVQDLDPMPDTWEAIDDLGRVLPTQSQSGTPRKDREVGIFYWTWHNYEHTWIPHNVSKIIKEHPEAVTEHHHPAWDNGTVGGYHWGEPLFGYYITRDYWIHRQHAQMLANAQVDVVVFDSTNGTLTWMESLDALARAYEDARRDGVKTPKFAYMLPFWDFNYTRTDLIQLWRDVYRDGRYKDLWYYWDGKPLIYANPDCLDEALAKETNEEAREELISIRKFFSFRPGQPAYTGGPQRPDHWSWLEVYPQHGYGIHKDGTIDMITVGVAQNHSSKRQDGGSGLAAMNDINVFGRAYQVGLPEDPDPNAFLYGGNFQQQWSRAFELDPRFVFVTGWNEWIAGRFDVWQGLPYAHPDEYNEPFSRDIEPENGILKDSFYMQLVANVRNYKGTRSLPSASGPLTIDLSETSSNDPWEEVAPLFRDYLGDTVHRDNIGYGDIRYTNDSGRNDIARSRVARDQENLYLMVETNEALTPCEESSWMTLFISTCWKPEDTAPNWEHFQYMVEEGPNGAVLKKSLGGWNWEEVAPVTRRIGTDRLELAIPLKLLDLDGKKVDIRFKWTDHTILDGDSLNFYQYGDAAPDGRFVYHYTAPSAGK